MRLNEMTATAAAAAIRRGEVSSEALVRACLDRIAELEERVRAWTWLDRDHALEQARDADRRRQRGEKPGALHGVPIGIKDVIDTADMPTENGTVLHAGRRPGEDATVVSLLRRSGAVILGKTVTTELAVYAPGKTANPHDPRRTPGGSSSGSAAAVAASMVPVALGTQTNGSLIRPASFCGVCGFKPSHGAISRHGVLAQSRTLDHVGVLARSVDDVALVARELFVADGIDPDVREGTRLDLDAQESGRPSSPPRVAFVKTPVWENATPVAKQAFAELAKRWGAFVREVELPPVFGYALDWHRSIMEPDIAKSFENEYEQGRARISTVLREMIERGRKVAAVDYSRALDGALALRRELDRLFDEYDVILTPATPGAAPMGLDATGSPMFCTLWTLVGVPAISVPILRGEEGMPMGAQLVGRKGDDAGLLRAARWLVEFESGERAS